MIKVFNITVTFVAIAIVTLFALTPQASAQSAPTGFTVAVTPTTITESTTPTDITVTVTLTGGTFTVPRSFQIGVANGTARAVTDYVSLPYTTITIPQNMASATKIVPFTAIDDMVVEASGETFNFVIAFLNTDGNDRDESIGSSKSVTITINDGVSDTDTAPAFAEGESIPLQSYVENTMITTLNFPEATGGNGPLTYTLTRADGVLPTGLIFDSSARPPTLTGTPSVVVNLIPYSYTVTDGDDNTDTSDTDTLTFLLAVIPSGVPLDFPSTVGIGEQPQAGSVFLYYPRNNPITPITFPAATGGVSPYTYTVANGIVPVGLSFGASGRVLSGTPSVSGVFIFTYSVTDSSTRQSSTELQSTIVICDTGGMADGATVCPIPNFVTFNLPTPVNQTFAKGFPITTLTLPEATGGTGANPMRIYTATPLPAGLSFDPTNREITGTPTEVGTTTVSYRVGDVGQGNLDHRSTTVAFDITVNNPLPTSITLSVIPATVEESSTAKRIILTATLVGGTFPTSKTVTYQSAGGTATATTDYTPITTTNLIIPSGQISASTDISFTTVEDELDEPDGETVFITGSLVGDNTFTITPATITILDEFSYLDFGGDNKVTSNDGLILYLVASGVNASALAIFVDGPGTTSEKTDRLNELKDRLQTDMKLDFGGDNKVTSNDGLILYLVASGVNASALAIFVDGPGTTSEKIDRLAALQTRIDTENGG